ncbi:DUF4283 domain protein [Trifolium medium]|uniref:DUF4283 domain protein n=1 Tax=Trifolium medium TaxID=97028 RepID=A0A392NJQ6_9FABA|nr:DUF4283 domain protein [Trifolium medium]
MADAILFLSMSLMMSTNSKFLVWNCRGAANTSFYRYCKQYVDMHKPALIVIVETRCDPLSLERTFKRLGYDGLVATEVQGYAGGIVVAWQKDCIDVEASMRRCNNFREQMHAAKLVDMGSIGPKFTWRGPIYHGGQRIYEKLDRALCNEKWRLSFPDGYVKILARVEFSDHHPILISPKDAPYIKAPRQFRFESACIS